MRRRTLLSLVAQSLVVPAGFSPALAPALARAEDPRMAQRAIGKPDAKTR